MAAEPGSASPAGEGSRPRLTKQREGEGRWERPLAAGQRGGGPGPERLGGPPQPGRYALPCPALPARPFVPALRERRAAASFLLPSPPSCSRRGPTHAPRRDGTAQRLRSATARRDSNPRPSTPRPPPPPPRRALTRRPPSQRCAALLRAAGWASGGILRTALHCTALPRKGRVWSAEPPVPGRRGTAPEMTRLWG